MKLSLTKPALGVYLLLGLLIPWQSGAKEPAALVVDGLILVLASFLLLRSDLSETRISGAEALLPAAYVAWGLLSLSWSVNRYQSVMWVIVTSIAVVAYYLARLIADQPALVKKWVIGYQLIAAAVMAYGVYFYFTLDYNRLVANFYLANPLSAFLVPAALLATWACVRQSSAKWWNWLLAVMLLAGVVLTDSRTGLIMLGLAGVAAAVIKMSGKQWLTVAKLAALTLAAVLSINLVRTEVFHKSMGAQGTRFNELATGDSTSGGDRWYFLRSALAITIEHPLQGSGAGTFVSEHPGHQYRVISASSNVHNYYAQTVSELGLVGGALLAALVIGLLLTIWRNYQHKSRLAFSLALFIMLVHLALDIDAIYPVILVILAVLAGFVMGGQKSDAKSKNVDLSSVVSGWALAALAIAAASFMAYQSYASAKIALRDQTDGYYAEAVTNYAAASGGYIYDPNVITDQAISLYSVSLLDKDRTARAGKLAQALELTKRAAKLDPLSSDHLYSMARIASIQGDHALAKASYQKAIALDPYNHPEYYLYLASELFKAKDYAASNATLTKILALYPPDVMANRAFIPGLTDKLAQLYMLRANGNLMLKKRDLARADLKMAYDISTQQSLKTQIKGFIDSIK